MAITSPEEFLRLLSKSKLLTPEQLAHAQDTVLLTSNAGEFSEILVDEGFLTPWQASKLLAGQTEFFIGNYVLLDLLGRGGMGHVFLARHKTMKRQVALKIISKKVGKDPASRDRFLSEARSAALLDHPNIVHAFDVDKDNDRYYIIMEYVAGEDLEGLVGQEGPLDFEFIVDCIRQAAEGLDHAHRRNLVHCDIKPSNLLLTETGTVKILDMGMARLLDQSVEDSGGDREGRIPGTVDYMAPEQAMEGPDFDHRADIYALGCTMFFLLTGRPPFDEGSLAQRIVQHQTQPPPDILELRPDTPPDLAQICLTMMAKNPADRFQSAEDLAKVLASWRPPVPAPAAVAPAAKPASTGVAIDEEDFKPPAVLQPAAGRSKAKSKQAAAKERRLIVGMAAGAVALGGLLVIVAVFVAARSGRTEAPLPDPPAPQARAPSTDEQKPSGGSESPEGLPKPGPSESQPSQPAAQAGELKAEPTTKPAPPKRKGSKRQGTRRPPPRVAQAEPELVTSSSTTGSASLDFAAGGSGSQTPSADAPSGLAHVGASPSASRAASRRPDPLRDLPEAIELPPRSEAGRPIVLGRLPLTPAEKPDVRLLGGEVAVKAPAHLVMETDPEKPLWVVRLVDAAGGQVDVASFSLRGEEIVFAWAEVSEGVPADALRNCLLEVQVGPSTRVVRLRKPSAETPLTLNLGKGTAEKRLAGGETVGVAALRLAITAVDGLPSGGNLKRPVVLVPGETKDISVFRRGDSALVLHARYGSPRAAGRSLQLTAYYQVPTRKKPAKLSANTVPWLLRRKALLTDEEPRLAATIENPALSDSQKRLRTADLKKKRDELEWLGEFLDWCQQSGGVVHVHFQKFVPIGNHRVLLVDTRLSPGASPGESPTESPPPASEPVDPAVQIAPVESGQSQTLK